MSQRQRSDANTGFGSNNGVTGHATRCGMHRTAFPDNIEDLGPHTPGL